MSSTAHEAGRTTARPVDKFEERRRELADAALVTLSELGYARTSLREIAHNTDFSHGVLHYYFRDKVDLITFCVRQYKAVCVQRYDSIIATATTPEGLSRGFADGLAATLVNDAGMHRLWYDLRSQSFFEESFRSDVLEIDATLERMIERIVGRYAELAGRPVPFGRRTTYAMFDGLFQQALLQHTTGSGDAVGDLRAGVRDIVAALFPEA